MKRAIVFGLALSAAACAARSTDPASPSSGGGNGGAMAMAPAGGCDCMSLAVAGEVGAAIQGAVARADGLYVRGDFSAAAAAYAAAHAQAPDPELLFAQGVATWKAGDVANARASLQAYLTAGEMLAFRAEAQAALDAMDGRAGALAGLAGATGAVAGTVGGVAGTGVGAAGVVGGAGLGVVGGVTGAIDKPKPKRLAKGAAIILGIVAVGAVGAVGIHGIGSMADDVEFDGKFGLGMGISGVVVGGTAIYLWGLTAATGVAAGAPCVAERPRTMVTPFATADGGGLAAVGSF